MKKTKKKFTDPNEMAFNVVSHTERMAEEKPAIDPAVSEAARALSKLGASKGGKARAKKLSAGQRKSIAKKAATLRWKRIKEPQPNRN